MRIVSLIASATEIACALGLEGSLVGRSHECDYPASVLRLPRLTRARIDAEADSAAIDRQVRERAKEKLSLYEVDGEALAALRPDLILTQVQCEVCAVSPKDVVRALAGRDIGAKVVPLGGADLAGVFDDILRVARAAGVDAAGRERVASLKSRLSALKKKAAGRPRPRVLCLEWLDPPMASGHWVPELVRAAGGEPVFGEAGRPSPAIAWKDVLAADPDVIVAMPCGFDEARTRRELAALKKPEGWERLAAVKAGRVHAADGNAYFNRPGPRLVDSAERLFDLLGR